MTATIADYHMAECRRNLTLALHYERARDFDMADLYGQIAATCVEQALTQGREEAPARLCA